MKQMNEVDVYKLVHLFVMIGHKSSFTIYKVELYTALRIHVRIPTIEHHEHTNTEEEPIAQEIAHQINLFTISEPQESEFVPPFY